jgi:transcriptional regulator with XRE-family HTH domain
MAKDGDLQTRFGQRVRALRKKRGLSQLDIVRRVAIDLSHYQRIERGDLDVRLSTAEKIAGVLGVSLSTLMRGL